MAKWGAGLNKAADNMQTVAYIGAASSSPRRTKVFELDMGCNATPADLSFLWIVQRCTTAGTGTAATPNAYDPGDSLATTTVVKGTMTADPTLTANAFLLKFPLNQRNTMRWIAKDGCEFIVPATASNGIIAGLSAVTTTSFDCGCGFEDQ